jgi:hypothetical protein
LFSQRKDGILIFVKQIEKGEFRLMPEDMTDQINLLRTGDIQELRVQKEHFLAFRAILSQQEDFKHFRGIAQQGGDVVFQYLQEPRS